MKILGLGDHVMDVYRNLKQAYPGGNALNVSVNATLLECQSAYLGVFGDDIYSTFIKQFLQAKKIALNLCEHKKKASTKRCVVDVHDGERQFSHVEMKANWAGVLHLSEEQIAYAQAFDAIFTSCNAKIESQLSSLKRRQGVLVFDFGEKSKYRSNDYLKKVIPYIDVALFSMSDVTLEEIDEFVKQLPPNLVVLITRGIEPTLCYHSLKCISHAQTIVLPVDTMGAGDAYVSAFVISLLKQGWMKQATLEEATVICAMQNASAHAALICRMHGGFNCPFQGLEAVIFDMDGVLVNSEVEYLRLFSQLLQEHGFTLRKEDEKRLYGCSYKEEDIMLCEYFQEAQPQVHAIKEEFFNRHQFTYNDLLMPGSKELLHYLYEIGVKLVIASSSSQIKIERMLHECEIESYFDFVVSGEMFVESKPNPQIYEHCITQLQLSQDHILVIEDSAYGIEAASRANLNVIQFQRNIQPKNDDRIVAVCESHHQILDFIKQNYI